MKKTLIVIPARYGSTRLPGKPLIEIAGKPVVQYVWETCVQVCASEDVVVATDDVRIVEAVVKFGGKAVMTSATASCGTDRLAEIAEAEGYQHEVYLNVQGDEPLLLAQDIRKLVELMDEPQADVGTLFHGISEEEAKVSSNVKVVTARNGRCLYFSRSQIPFERQPGGGALRFKKHVGLYAFTAETLKQWTALPAGDLEEREMLEQLRLLEAGMSLFAAEIEPTGPGVDTPESLAQVRAILEASC
jgi:3-deoxy-D-manno-octulosonate 8-phosphate phosphatase (KDO 8-P phosphatase)